MIVSILRIGRAWLLAFSFVVGWFGFMVLPEYLIQPDAPLQIVSTLPFHL